MMDAQRMMEQFIWRISSWILINVILFVDLGGGALFSLSGLGWVVLGTIFVLSVWSMFGAFVERAFLLRGWNIYLWRVIELCILGGLSRQILVAIQ